MTCSIREQIFGNEDSYLPTYQLNLVEPSLLKFALRMAKDTKMLNTDIRVIFLNNADVPAELILNLQQSTLEDTFSYCSAKIFHLKLSCSNDTFSTVNHYQLNSSYSALLCFFTLFYLKYAIHNNR